MNNEVLNSWKEIAAYLGRGVRTVQRWENDLSLPVRRPRGKDRSAVIALKPELDKWLHDVPSRSVTPHSTKHEQLHLNTQRLLNRSQEILERTKMLQETFKNTLAVTVQLKTHQSARVRQQMSEGNRQAVLVARTVELGSAIEQRVKAGGGTA